MKLALIVFTRHLNNGVIVENLVLTQKAPRKVESLIDEDP
jgi:hypothetical protein